MKNLFYIVLSVILFSSCDENITLGNIDPFLGTWELKNVLIGGDAISTPPSKITIIFSERSNNLIFSGNSTCNFYGGEVIKITSKNDISLSEMYTTEMACDPDLLNLYENEYYNWLTKTTQYSIEDNKLVLYSENANLNFEKVD